MSVQSTHTIESTYDQFTNIPQEDLDAIRTGIIYASTGLGQYAAAQMMVALHQDHLLKAKSWSDRAHDRARGIRTVNGAVTQERLRALCDELRAREKIWQSQKQSTAYHHFLNALGNLDDAVTQFEVRITM